MQTAQAASLAGTRLDRHYHACAFFHTREEEYRVLSPFISEGLSWGEKELHITDPKRREDHLARLAAAGIPVDASMASAQLELLSWQDAYLRGGRFDAPAMLEMLEEIIKKSKDQGFPRTRIIGHMEWALEDCPGVADVIEYEARVNEVLARNQQPAVCVYDATRHDAALILDVLRTHPLVIIGGVLQENPFFMPPELFLQDFRARRAAGME